MFILNIHHHFIILYFKFINKRFASGIIYNKDLQPYGSIQGEIKKVSLLVDGILGKNNIKKVYKL
ncbi:hypothetical protein AN2V17_35500 [Vallitalea sp. AN17-2]|uniref:Uncharacterized protein n=1 Tax=Vallitalea maricola TaxID=3074433 RepID=A0ACB5UP48_9FIRM|nr:hypothetical protein AN2V17_35500 [Vallitalea sp. AN17-2]